MTLWPYGGSESGLGGMSCLVPQPNGTQGSCVDGRERRSPTAPNAVLLDIGMTVVHPDGHKLLAHAAHARPGYTADPEDLARALCLASSASHWPLPRVGGVERVARVWSALVDLRPMEGLQTLQACFQDDDFYSEMEPDLRDTLKRLRAGDRRLAAITNSTRPVRDELERLGISDLFDAAVDSTAVGISKPKAGIFAACLAELRLEPGACWFVGDDNVGDILGAWAAGFGRVVLLDRAAAFEGLPWPVRIKRLSQLPNLLEGNDDLAA